MRYDFDSIVERRGTPNLKWNAYPADVLPMFVADMDFASPAPVVAALRRQVDSGLFGYPDGSPGPEREAPGLRAAVADRMLTRYGWRVQPEDLVLLPGVVTGVHLTIHAFTGSAGAVLVQPPVYPPLHMAAKVTGRRKIESPLVQDPAGDYAVDWDHFRAAAGQ